jgi:Fe-S-cluster-containing hydrogenase component 2
MRASTKALMAKHGWLIDKAIHNYIYFAFYYPYVWTITQFVVKFAPHFAWFKPLNPVLRMISNRYHAKVLSGSNVTKILELQEDLSAVTDQNKKIIPFEYAYKILLQNPQYIAVMDCPCKKAAKSDPDTINSCICVGKKTAEFWIDRCGEKYNARRINQQEALDMVKRFRKMGYITQAFFKVATGGSTSVICNCHKKDCTALKAHFQIKKYDPHLRMIAESGYSVKFSQSAKCKSCMTCAKICQFEAIEFNNGKRDYNRDNCIGCGLCVEHCESGVIELYRDTEKSVPLDIDLVRDQYVKI